MAKQLLILTVIGDDRPGLVGELSAAISAHQGNWLESSMSRLGGKFAGIVKVEVATDQAVALQADLATLTGLKVTAETSAPEIAAKGRRLRFSLVGHDRVGIVREVTQVLARHAVNVEELTTRTSSAPMSAERLFHAEAELLAGPELDSAALARALEAISNDLMVDISLDETLA
ncbi:MAG: ACT domain-containing protein [Rhodocyclaceae bacterium]|jgi:glycine cleavage system regulatory protein|nr:ACT domain-containing protein [Rhodocyclaceae bacterium]